MESKGDGGAAPAQEGFSAAGLAAQVLSNNLRLEGATLGSGEGVSGELDELERVGTGQINGHPQFQPES